MLMPWPPAHHAECQEGHVLSDDGLTCVDSIAVALGRGIYTNPIVQGASNHTQVQLPGRACMQTVDSLVEPCLHGRIGFLARAATN